MVGWGGGGPLFADDIANRQRESVIRLALQEIVDAQGYVDAFIAQQSEKARTTPAIAAEIAQRLIESWMRRGGLERNQCRRTTETWLDSLRS